MEPLSKIIENLEAYAEAIERNTYEETYVCIPSGDVRWVVEELRKSARSLRDGVMPDPPFIMAGTVKHSGDLYNGEHEKVDQKGARMSRCIPIDWCQDGSGKPIRGSVSTEIELSHHAIEGPMQCSICGDMFARQSPRWIHYQSRDFWAHYCRIESLMGQFGAANVNAGWLLHQYLKDGPGEMEEPLGPGAEELPR